MLTKPEHEHEHKKSTAWRCGRSMGVTRALDPRVHPSFAITNCIVGYGSFAKEMDARVKLEHDDVIRAREKRPKAPASRRSAPGGSRPCPSRPDPDTGTGNGTRRPASSRSRPCRRICGVCASPDPARRHTSRANPDGARTVPGCWSRRTG